ncbi:MAG: metallophosphoesterase [Bacteroidetes bacterium]|nr:MAG: metallophosphoesterase [Bacteroidota bacterium]
MKIQYCSDLHLEFDANADFIKQNPIQAVGDIIILAGDISYLNFYYERQVEKDFISYLSNNFQYTYLMFGNHEFYNGDDISILDKAVYEKLKDNVALVNNVACIHDDIKIIFSTLWSKISEPNRNIVLNGMNDFRLISYHNKNFTVDDYNKIHEKSIQYISEELNNNSIDQKTIIATHHVPSKSCNSPDFANSPINEAFVVDLDELIQKSRIDYWIYGHTHRNMPETIVGNTKLLTNQLGYISYNENKGYKSDRILTI